jgi:serine/threonine protein kinase
MQFPITAIREIKILKKLHHENVIKLKEIVTSPGTLVFLDLKTSIFYGWLTTILNYFAHTFCILLLRVRSRDR